MRVRIKGGNKVDGQVRLVGNKNSYLPAICASLLFDHVKYVKAPDTSDVRVLLDVLRAIGAKIDESGSDLKISTGSVSTSDIISNYKGPSVRSVLLFAGPLLARFGEVTIPLPGGCILGHRGIGAHVDIFQKMGIGYEAIEGGVRFFVDKKINEDLVVYTMESSVTATENALLYLYGANRSGNVTLDFAAAEPHVQDLCNFLAEYGLPLSGIGSNRLHVGINQTDGRKGFIKKFQGRVDFVDFCGYAVLAAITNGEITIANFDESVNRHLIEWLKPFGIKFEVDDNHVHISRDRDLFIDHSGSFPMEQPRLPKLIPMPWPGFPVDCIPVMVVLACCMSRGSIAIMNQMYEDGLQLVRELKMLGAQITIVSPHKIIVHAKDSFFYGKELDLMPPRVIESVKATVFAAIASQAGSSIIVRNAELLYRRYDNFVNDMRELGVDIEILD